MDVVENGQDSECARWTRTGRPDRSGAAAGRRASPQRGPARPRTQAASESGRRRPLHPSAPTATPAPFISSSHHTHRQQSAGLSFCSRPAGRKPASVRRREGRREGGAEVRPARVADARGPETRGPTVGQGSEAAARARRGRRDGNTPPIPAGVSTTNGLCTTAHAYRDGHGWSGRAGRRGAVRSLSGRERKNETQWWGGRCSLALNAFIFEARVRRPPFSAATTPASMPRQAPSGPAPVARRGAADRADPPPSASAGTATARAGGGAEVVFASADARQGTPKKAKLAAMQGRTIYRRRDGSVRQKNVSVGEGRLPRGGGEGRAHCLGKVDSGRGGWEWCSPFVRLTRNPRT
jgi:hypothetical protein